MEQTTVKQPLELENGKEYEHRTYGRVMFIAVYPHDGATLVIEHERSSDDLAFETCERGDLTPCNDGESYWPFLGRNCKERQRQARERNAMQAERRAAEHEIKKEISKEAQSYNVTILVPGDTWDHIKLIGKVEVNYWPFSRGKTAHVKGERQGVRNVTPEQACRMAQQIIEGE